MLSFTLSIILSTMLLMIPILKSKPTYFDTICIDKIKFANNSRYQTNLNTVFHNLTSNSVSSLNGFYHTTAGNTKSDTVYGLFLCRGDQNVTSCSDCVTIATTGLPTYCPNQKVAVTWYDECMVRYSNEPMIGITSLAPSLWVYNNDRNLTGNKTRFEEILGNTLVEISKEAAKGDEKKYGTKVVKISDSETLYALVQCTPDLSTDSCYTCLTDANAHLKLQADFSCMSPTCSSRYSTSPFFNYSRDDISVPPAKQTSMNPRGMETSWKVVIVVAAVVLSILVTLLLAVFICRIKKKAEKYVTFATQFGDNFTDVESLQYSLGELQIATNQFSHENKLGRGGFGVVYKGTLRNGQEIAVKKLSSGSNQGLHEFKNEVLLLAKLQHRNLVRLLGFCLDGEEKLLVYEYVPNKSLDYFLKDPQRHGELGWRVRYKIMAGVARGMLYLHQDSLVRVIHRDLKAANILLDMDMNPKIADFGMARIFGADQIQITTTRVVGTYGYMAPEYALKGQFSIKSDVYSFGVLVLEIMCGKRNTAEEDLLSYVWKKWKDGALMGLVDSRIRDSDLATEVVNWIQLALLCVQKSAYKRPTMAIVVRKLDSHSKTLPEPEQPGFFIRGGLDIGSSQSTSNSKTISVNDESVTEVEPR